MRELPEGLSFGLKTGDRLWNSCLSDAPFQSPFTDPYLLILNLIYGSDTRNCRDPEEPRALSQDQLSPLAVGVISSFSSLLVDQKTPVGTTPNTGLDLHLARPCYQL